MVLISLNPLGADAQGINDIINTLEGAPCYRADATFSVMLPQATDDVVYNLKLESSATPGNRLSPCDYVIDWTLDTPSGPANGFSAYYDGHHYRYRADRLQEYHMAWDSIPFAPRGRVADGVQRRAQFADILPQFIGEQLAAMEADSLWTLTVADGRHRGNPCVTVKAVMRIDGTMARRSTYILDATTLMPLSVESENNIGAISEQTVTVAYTPGESNCDPITEEALIARYPEPFEKYRENNFRIENAPGTLLPQFTLPDVDGRRYTHHRGESMGSPVIIAILDPTAGSNQAIVSALRQAAQAIGDVEVLWAVDTSNIDRITEIIPDARPGEHRLLNGRTLARDLGASTLPVIVMAGADSKIHDVVLGHNNNLATIVIQKMALIGR